MAVEVPWSNTREVGVVRFPGEQVEAGEDVKAVLPILHLKGLCLIDDADLDG